VKPVAVHRVELLSLRYRRTKTEYNGVVQENIRTVDLVGGSNRREENIFVISALY